MPNKTIYIAEADLPILERAQRITSETLSATIVRALRHLIAAEEGDAAQFTVIRVRIGEAGASCTQRFLGRELARRCVREAGSITRQIVYQTAKGQLALHTARRPDWPNWSRYGARYGAGAAGGAPPGESYRLAVYATLDELRPHAPPELAAAVERALASGNALLDI